MPTLLLGLLLSAPATLFPSRVPLAPYEAKLKESGGSPGRVLVPKAEAELLELESGRRYKFVVREDGALAIAPLPADAPENPYVHPVLGEGRPVRTAGGLRVEHEGRRLVRVVVDQDSQAYCPTLESLSAAVDALARLGVPRSEVHRQDSPPRCAAADAGQVQMR